MKITFELDAKEEKALEALQLLLGVSTTKVTKTEEPTQTPKKPETAKSASKSTETAKKAESRTTDPTFEDLEDDAKLEALKTTVTNLVKKSKGDAVKQIFGRFSVNKTSELSPDQYNDIYSLLSRLAKGETIEALLGEEFN